MLLLDNLLGIVNNAKFWGRGGTPPKRRKPSSLQDDRYPSRLYGPRPIRTRSQRRSAAALVSHQDRQNRERSRQRLQDKREQEQQRIERITTAAAKRATQAWKERNAVNE